MSTTNGDVPSMEKVVLDHLAKVADKYNHALSELDRNVFSESLIQAISGAYTLQITIRAGELRGQSAPEIESELKNLENELDDKLRHVIDLWRR